MQATAIWKECPACGAITDHDEEYCPARCPDFDNSPLREKHLELSALSDLIQTHRLWTKKPGDIYLR